MKILPFRHNIRMCLTTATIMIATACFATTPRNKTSEPATALIKEVTVDPSVTYDGIKGIVVHCEVDIDGVKDKEIEFQAIFYSSPGGWALRDLNDKYRLSPSLGYVAASSFIEKATQNSYELKDMGIFIPTEELHLRTGNKYRVYVKVSIYTNPGRGGEFLGESDYVPFVVDMKGAVAE